MLPPSPRNRELAVGPLGWFGDHVLNRTDCWCTLDSADPRCDLGEALFRVKASELARRVTTCTCRNPLCPNQRHHR